MARLRSEKDSASNDLLFGRPRFNQRFHLPFFASFFLSSFLLFTADQTRVVLPHDPPRYSMCTFRSYFLPRYTFLSRRRRPRDLARSRTSFPRVYIKLSFASSLEEASILVIYRGDSRASTIGLLRIFYDKSFRNVFPHGFLRILNH